MSIRMSISRANRITDPRLLAALPDPRVGAIQGAIRRCKASGHRRENLMYGRTVWPRDIVAFFDELLGKASDGQIMAVGDAIRDAAYATVLQGTGAPRESVADALATEMSIEGESNRLSMMLIGDERNPARLRQAAEALGRERDATERARLVLICEADRREREQMVGVQ